MFKRKARSRLQRTQNNRYKRMKLELVIFCSLFAVYLGTKLFANLVIFHPVETLANTDLTLVTVEKEVIKEQPRENVDTWIGDAVDEFLPKHKSESRMIMHCLAHRENGHGGNPDGHGDGGLAGGPFQFHEATWQRMRKQMIKQGVAKDMSTRYDFKEAARTTAWAINNGNAKEWGPILRDSNGSNYAACQTPSWYK